MIVVLFRTRLRPDVALPEYEALGGRMYELVSAMPGFVSFAAYTSPDGEELGVAQFESEKALEQWRNHPEHLGAQRQGKERFFASYHIQVCSLIREYGTGQPTPAG